jgi:hypothetical protein
MCTLLFGVVGGERIEIHLADPTSGWIETSVSIVVDGFSGELRLSFELRDLERLGESLAKLYASLSGKAVLEGREEQLVLTLEGNGRGAIAIKGSAYARPTYGNCLEFELEIDQTFLPEILRLLRGYLQAHGSVHA